MSLGWKNKAHKTTIANVAPASVVVEQHRKMAECR
jgi:hypothetical protein